ncbi:MAG: DnaA/Hda family protein [Alphaproteobacteria bacterium]
MKSLSQGQLIFDLAHKVSFDSEDFLVVPGNQQAVAWFERWPQWSAPGLILYGPEGAGKSHLARIWQRRSQAYLATVEEMVKGLMTDRIKPAMSYLIEDIDQLTGVQNERAFLHFYNWIAENRGYIAMTARRAVSKWPLTVPDLTSRLKALPQISIEPPNDEMLGLVLVKLFSDRQLRIGEDILNYILPRIERTPRAAAKLVDTLDRVSLETGRPITVPLVRAVMAKTSSDN